MESPEDSLFILAPGVQPNPGPAAAPLFAFYALLLFIVVDRKFRVVLWLVLCLFHHLDSISVKWNIVKLHLVLFHLIFDVVADLQLFLEVSQIASSVEEKTDGFLEGLFVVGTGGDVYLSFRKDGVFSVHQFVEKDTQRVCIVSGTSSARLFFELSVVKVRDVSLVNQQFLYSLRHGRDLSDFRNSVIDVYIFDVQHVERD